MIVDMDRPAGQQLMVFTVVGLLAEFGHWKDSAMAAQVLDAIKKSQGTDYVEWCADAWLTDS